MPQVSKYYKKLMIKTTDLSNALVACRLFIYSNILPISFFSLL